MHKQFYLAKRNPTVSEEDWPRTWRSHAIFASQFKGAVSKISSVSYCPRVYHPTLDGEPFDPPQASREYDGVAVVAGPTADTFAGARRGITIEELQVVTGLSADNLTLLLADELRVFAGHVPDFSFLGEEVLVHGAAPGKAAVIRFLPGKSGQSRDAFLAAFAAHGVAGARAADDAGNVVRYVHNVVTAPPPPGYPFVGIIETWFGTIEEAVRSFADPAFASLADSLDGFCDSGGIVTMLTHATHRWPRD